MIEVVIFDCDGVLFDSREANTVFYNHILSEFQLPPMTEEDLEYVHVSTAAGALHFLLSRRDPTLTNRVLAYSRRMEYKPFIRLMRMEPHLRELLELLPRRTKRAISTNRTYSIGDVLRIHGLMGAFDLVVSALDVQNPKPHPDSILKILDYFAVEPSQALFIGDSDVDQKSARSARVQFVAYKNPSLEADYHIEDLLTVASIVDSMPRK